MRSSAERKAFVAPPVLSGGATPRALSRPPNRDGMLRAGDALDIVVRTMDHEDAHTDSKIYVRLHGAGCFVRPHSCKWAIASRCTARGVP
eukprot:SAG31_NODE_10407_length_1142_cov_0.885906_1_plen_89_part_10